MFEHEADRRNNYIRLGVDKTQNIDFCVNPIPDKYPGKFLAIHIQKGGVFVSYSDDGKSFAFLRHSPAISYYSDTHNNFVYHEARDRWLLFCRPRAYAGDHECSSFCFRYRHAGTEVAWLSERIVAFTLRVKKPALRSTLPIEWNANSGFGFITHSVMATLDSTLPHRKITMRNVSTSSQLFAGILSIVLHGTGSLQSQETLLTIEPTDNHPRNSEGDIIELEDGRICLIYNRFSGGTSDHAAADLAMRTSRDGGKTWTDDKIVVRREGGNNVMSVSLLRLTDGRIALFYLRKQSLEDCRPIMRISSDMCKSFGEAIECIGDQIGYYVLNNDRALQLKSGRLVLPVALHNKPGQEKPDWAGRVMCYLSDDVGKTWRRSQTTLIGRSEIGDRVTVQEPGVVQLKDDRLMMFCRTDAGSQFVTYSSDEGDTWSKLSSSSLESPVSPASIERIPWSGQLLCVWNDHSGVHPFPTGKRSPLCIAMSRDEGKTWSRSRAIETDPDGWYCYTAMTLVKDRVLLAYCAGDKQVGGLNRLKVVSLSRQLLERVSAAGPAIPPQKPLLDLCLDYGRSFINTKASFNSPRFWVESRCRVMDETANKTVEYLQCGLCKAENTFANRQLFQNDNYDFLPVFSLEEGIIFRRYVRVSEPYRDVRPVEKWWGGLERKLQTGRGRVLRTPDEIFEAMQAGKPIVGQTEIRDEKTGRVAIIEFPIKTINFERDQKDWQVDTGPIITPATSTKPPATSC